MAVEAYHHHLFPSQLLRNRELFGAENQPSFYNMQTGLVLPVSGSTAACSFLPDYNSSAPAATAAASDSGLTFNNAAAMVAASRKRLRPHPPSFLGDDIIMSAHLQQQMLDIDRLILQHDEKVRVELTERRKRFTRQILSSVEEGVSKRLKAREEEIARIGKLNWALEGRIKSLCVENQLWRDLAQRNEAAANALRTNLEQVLVAQVRVKDEAAAAATADDAESCCCAGNVEEEEEDMAGLRRRACRSCGEREPSVLLLPCRHLCLCAACGPAVNACPICKCSKAGSVIVNMS